MADTQTFRSWGECWSDAYPWAEDWRCPNCRWAYHSVYEKSCVIGFKSELSRGAFGSKKIGTVTVECPNCFTKFWFHVDECSVIPIRMNCPNWPKE